jgi:alpha-beta hydrolase superfamily lysophospholipase
LWHLFYEGLHNQLPDWLRNAGYRAFVFLFLKDVRLFMADAAVRQAAIASVQDDLFRVRPDVVIAHSLGAVIAVEALARSDWAQSPQLLVTAGAPFAWPWFIDSWSPAAAAWLAAKRCEWWNMVDLSDEVTANRVPPEFPYVAARHVVVNNDRFTLSPATTDDRHTSNHRARDYLRHPTLSDAIGALLEVARE